MAKKQVKKKYKPNLFSGGGNLAGNQKIMGGPRPIDNPAFNKGSVFGKQDIGSTKLQAPNMGSQGGGALGGAVGGLGAAGDILKAGTANAQIADTSGIKADIGEQENMAVAANTNDTLMNEWGSWNKTKDDYSWRELRGGSNAGRAMNTVGAVGSGAAAGAQIGGPWGAVIGGIVGLGGAVGGWISGNKKAKRASRRLNKQAADANDRAILSFETRADNIDKQNDFNLMANYSAYGGPISSGIGAIGYDFISQSMNNQAMRNFTNQKFTSLPNSFGVPNLKALGGLLQVNGGEFSNGVSFVDEGGTHEENPYEGVQVGVDPEGIPNLVEEGEVMYNNYVFSDRIKVPKEAKKEFGITGDTFAKAAKSAQRESKERPFDPISQRGLQDSLNKLQVVQEAIKSQEEPETTPNVFARGGERQTWTKYAPIVGSGMGTISSIFEKPDLRGLEDLNNNTINPQTVGWSPNGNYLAFNPMDRDFYINKLNKNAASTRASLVNTSGGNRAVAQAGILSADQNYGENLGLLARQAEEYNDNKRERVEGFNRQTNMFNTETGLRADTFNASSINEAQRTNLAKRQQLLALRQSIKDGVIARRSANMTNFLQGLGDLGWENENYNWADRLAEDGVFKIDTQGNYTGAPKKEPKSGKVNKRKGFTYG